MKTSQQPRPTITLEPPWWKCAHGTEFRSSSGQKPQGCPRTPSCRDDDIQMVVDVDPAFSPKEKETR